MTDTPTSSVLQADGLHKAYNGKPALKGVTLSLQPGEMVALLGPNGAGKSTLLQLLTGLFTPDQGAITVLGHDMRTHPARALAGLGVVFQQSALDQDLTVMANEVSRVIFNRARAAGRLHVDQIAVMYETQRQAAASIENIMNRRRDRRRVMLLDMDGTLTPQRLVKELGRLPGDATPAASQRPRRRPARGR